MTSDGIPDDQSVRSNTSTASSVHEIVVFETKRKKELLARIRNRRRNKKGKTTGDDISTSSTTESCAGSSGIMSVRTLEESLGDSSVTKMRKLRRRVTIKFKSPDGEGVEDNEEITLSARSAASVLGDISLDFSRVYIREYEVVPGENPSCTSGPPLELGWAHGTTLDFCIDKFEGVREGRRRLQAQMRMPADARRGLLLQHGSSQKMIREATKACAAVRKQRVQTIEELEDKKKNGSKGIRGMFGRGKKK